MSAAALRIPPVVTRSIGPRFTLVGPLARDGARYSRLDFD